MFPTCRASVHSANAADAKALALLYAVVACYICSHTLAGDARRRLGLPSNMNGDDWSLIASALTGSAAMCSCMPIHLLEDVGGLQL